MESEILVAPKFVWRGWTIIFIVVLLSECIFPLFPEERAEGWLTWRSQSLAAAKTMMHRT